MRDRTLARVFNAGDLCETLFMTTAREKLYEEMVAMVASPVTATSDAEMRKLMTRYRVQTKPGVDVAPGTTARDALGDRLLELWRTQPADIKAKIGTAIDEFRMQLKSSSSPPAPAGPSRPMAVGAQKPRPVSSLGAPVPAVEDDDEPARAPPPRPADRSMTLGVGDPPPPAAALKGRAGRATAEPVAGGPRKRGRTRGECPKCHSMGVVLARSYSGDEYFSCIYCGWQAYKPTEEDDPNASLAVRLLGQSPPETPRE